MGTPKRHILLALIIITCYFLISGCNLLLIKPSNMVQLAAVVIPGQTESLRTGTPQGTGGGVYRVPAEKVLVITRVIIQPMNLGLGALDITFIQSDASLEDRIRQTWRVPNSHSTEYDFSPGYLISSGSNLKIRNNSNSAGDVTILIFGYITSYQ